MAAKEATLDDWIFGYGSILDDFAPTCRACVAARLSARAGYRRAWSFRSPTGFTAVGVRREKADADREIDNDDVGMVGILFRIGEGQHANTASQIRSSPSPSPSFISNSVLSLEALDQREAGYERVRVDLSYFAQVSTELMDKDATTSAVMPDPGTSRVWIYIPLPAFSKPPSSDFPICQTYVDTIVRGCLKWGGPSLAIEWIQTTHGWSEFWLNDAPMSRRPWLHRQKYAEIDAALLDALGSTKFSERRHPEEFSARWMSTLRGFWGVPPRNPNFIGRERELAEIDRCFNSNLDQGSVGVTMIETVGLGGVGKTQVAVEYCYRHWNNNNEHTDNRSRTIDDAVFSGSTRDYSLIVWLRAETAEVLGADFRRFAADSGIASVQSARNEDVVAEVLSKLYQSTRPWLMVLDNITDRDSLEAYLPRGSGGGFAGGHVLVTSREFLPGFRPEERVELRCFEKSESLDLLRRAGGPHLEIDEPFVAEPPRGCARQAGSDLATASAGEVLAIRLGHLPLALSIAAAFMRQCDVSCGAYIRKLNRRGRRNGGGDQNRQRLPGYPMGVEDSLMLSLNRIQGGQGSDNRRQQAELREVVGGAQVGMLSPGAILKTLCYLYPDDISKSLLTTIVECLILCRRRITTPEKNTAVLVAKTGIQMYETKTIVQTACAAAMVSSMVVVAGSLWAGRGNNEASVLRAQKFGIVATMISIATLGAVTMGSAASTDSASTGGDTRRRNSSTEYDHEEVNRQECEVTLWHHPLMDNLNTEEKESEKEDHGHTTELLADHLWIKLKKYSLLTVQRGHASMHRLLQQLLRSGQDKLRQRCMALSTCIWSVERLWNFDPADPSSWAEAGTVVDHMQVIGKHVLELVAQCRAEQDVDSSPTRSSSRFSPFSSWHWRWSLPCELQIRTSKLLTESALYMSMALSRFKEARGVLEIALSILTDGLLPPNDLTLPSASLIASRLGSSLSFTMHTAGKVSRYCGKYEEAAEFLQGALQLRGGVTSSYSSSSYEIAATLHELGVLHIKSADWNSARDLLTKSLNMKRALADQVSRGENSALDRITKRTDAAKAMRFSEEAATLHQLAVVSISSKPRRLDVAETLLREALKVMHDYDGPFSVGGRAATLQKLAQVLEYRGKRREARTILEEAMDLYIETYGDGVAHVNIAAVLTSLGSSCFSEKRFEEAGAYLRKSLCMRRKIYGVSDEGAGEGAAQKVSSNNNVEIAMNLCKLGEVERAMGNWDAAMIYIVKGRQVYDMLLSHECARLGGSVVTTRKRKSIGKDKLCDGDTRYRAKLLLSLSSCSSPPSLILLRLLRQSIQAASWERKLAKAVGDVRREETVSEELVQMRAVWTTLGTQSDKATDSSAAATSDFSSPPSGTTFNVHSTSLLGESLAICRADVRALVLNVRQGKDKEALAVALCDRVSAMEQYVLENHKVCDPCSEMIAAGAAFVRAIRSAAKSDKKEKRLRSGVFQACDALRAALRGCGLEIVDRDHG